MNAPKISGADWALIAKIAGGALAGAIIAVTATLSTIPSSRADVWTGSEHKAYHEAERERRGIIDDQMNGRMDRLEEAIQHLAQVVESHVSQDMHEGSRLQLATLTLSLNHITEKLVIIDRRLTDLQKDRE